MLRLSDPSASTKAANGACRVRTVAHTVRSLSGGRAPTLLAATSQTQIIHEPLQPTSFASKLCRTVVNQSFSVELWTISRLVRMRRT